MGTAFAELLEQFNVLKQETSVKFDKLNKEKKDSLRNIEKENKELNIKLNTQTNSYESNFSKTIFSIAITS